MQAGFGTKKVYLFYAFFVLLICTFFVLYFGMGEAKMFSMIVFNRHTKNDYAYYFSGITELRNKNSTIFEVVA